MINLDFTNEEWTKLEKTSKYPFGFYRLLGVILSYYGGTYYPQKHILQSITVSPWAKNAEIKIQYLQQICNSLFVATNLENDLAINIHKDDFEQTTTYTLSSENLCNYLIKVEYGSVEELFIPLFKSGIEIRPVIYRQRFEFLVGSYINHAISNIGEWTFSNNYQKMLLVHRFLTDLISIEGEEDDMIIVESHFRTPHMHRIKLDLNGELWLKIDRELKKMNNNK